MKRRASVEAEELRRGSDGPDLGLGYSAGFCWRALFLPGCAPDLGPWPTREVLLFHGAPEGGPVRYVRPGLYHVDSQYPTTDLESIPDGSRVGGYWSDVSDQLACSEFRSVQGLVVRERLFRLVSNVHRVRYRMCQEKGSPLFLSRLSRWKTKNFRVQRDRQWRPQQFPLLEKTRRRNFVPRSVLARSISLREKKLLYQLAPTRLEAITERDRNEELIVEDLSAVLDAQSYFFALDEPSSIPGSTRVDSSLGRSVTHSLGGREFYRGFDDSGPARVAEVQRIEDSMYSAMESSLFVEDSVVTFPPPNKGMRSSRLPLEPGVAPTSSGSLGLTAVVPSVSGTRKKKAQRAYFAV